MVDTINLYEINETKFENNGIGPLPDASKCTITEERNGEYELIMEYPINGKNFSELKLKRIIFSKPNPDDRKQPFRIYNISKPLNGIVTIKAEHVRYDLSGYPVVSCKAVSAASALSALVNESPVPCPFTTWSDQTRTGTFTVDYPSSILSVLGGNEGSVLDVYHGEYEWDRFNIKLHKERGKDRGVTIRYGKNLTDLTQEENCSNLYTGVLPYWKGTSISSEEMKVTLPEYIVDVGGTFSFTRILTLDLSSEFQEAPSENQLREKTQTYISNNNIGKPEVNLTVSFVKLSQTNEYEDYKLLETVKLCDIVTVQFPELGVDVSSKVISTTYDAITGKYSEIKLGESTSKNIAKTVSVTTKALNEEIPTISMVQQISEETSKLFNGCYGGYISWNYIEGQDKPYEMLIMDTDNVETAKNVWRLNNAGIAFSNNGYNGPWIVGMNMNGNINGQIIAAGTIDGNAIQSGSIDISDLAGAEEVVVRSELAFMSEYFEEGELWFDFDRYRNSGLWIGRKDSRFAINITNTKMSFVELPEDIQLTNIEGHGYFMDGDKTLFLRKINSKSGVYKFVYNDANQWILDKNVVQLSDYGIASDASPVEGWTITVTVQSFSDYENGNIKAYVAYNKLFIPTAHVQEYLDFGKNYKAEIQSSTSGLNAVFNTIEDMKTFIAKIDKKEGTYSFEYYNNKWGLFSSNTWGGLSQKSWNIVGAIGWYLGEKNVLIENYGITTSRNPVKDDVVICVFSGEPMADYSFIVKESGGLQIKWVGEEEV